MDMPWHLVVVAADDMGYVNCPHCLFTHRYSSNETVGRYQLLFRLTQTQQWAQLVAGKHKYVYFPDEAVVQDVSAMSTYDADPTACNICLYIRVTRFSHVDLQPCSVCVHMPLLLNLKLRWSFPPNPSHTKSLPPVPLSLYPLPLLPSISSHSWLLQRISSPVVRKRSV